MDRDRIIAQHIDRLTSLLNERDQEPALVEYHWTLAVTFRMGEEYQWASFEGVVEVTFGETRSEVYRDVRAIASQALNLGLEAFVVTSFSLAPNVLR